MKVLKYNEGKAERFRLVDAQQLARKLGKKFFIHLDEFEKILVNDESDDVIGQKSFMFYICFTEVHIETVKAMEKFNIFIGRIAADQWVFKTGRFDDGKQYIFDFIDLYIKDMNKISKKLKIEEDANKYNL